jgi:hypothetical protein
MKNLVELKEYFETQLKSSYDNYSIGVWQPEEYMGIMSKRALNAYDDPSKRSESGLIYMIGKITGDNNDLILKILRKIICEDLLEWHHVGKGRGKNRKKEYFYNADQIIRICENYDNVKKQILDEIEQEKLLKEKAKEELPILQNQLKELESKAKWFSRLREKPEGFIVVVYSEMKGKYGWFDSNPRYSCPEYFTGYIFETKEEKEAYRELKNRIETLKELIYS